MRRTAKPFRNGRGHAVRLPVEFRFEGDEVFIRQDPLTGDVILSRHPESWEGFFQLADAAGVPGDFMPDRGDSKPQDRAWTPERGFAFLAVPVGAATGDRAFIAIGGVAGVANGCRCCSQYSAGAPGPDRRQVIRANSAIVPGAGTRAFPRRPYPSLARPPVQTAARAPAAAPQ